MASEEQVRALAREVLKEKGYAVLEASEGRVALLIGQRHTGPIDLVLTDIVTPDMSGQVLAERLAQFRPEIRVLYMSGYVGEIYGVMPRGQALLSKPFTPEMLVAKVREKLSAPSV